MINEFDRIVLTKNIPDSVLRSGDEGVVVLVHSQGEAYEVEFMTPDGRTKAIETLTSDQVRSIDNAPISVPFPKEK